MLKVNGKPVYAETKDGKIHAVDGDYLHDRHRILITWTLCEKDVTDIFTDERPTYSSHILSEITCQNCLSKLSMLSAAPTPAPTDMSAFPFDRYEYVVLSPIRKDENGNLTTEPAPSEKVDLEKLADEIALQICKKEGLDPDAYDEMYTKNKNIYNAIEALTILAARYDFVPRGK